METSPLAFFPDSTIAKDCQMYKRNSQSHSFTSSFHQKQRNVSSPPVPSRHYQIYRTLHNDTTEAHSRRPYVRYSTRHLYDSSASGVGVAVRKHAGRAGLVGIEHIGAKVLTVLDLCRHLVPEMRETIGRRIFGVVVSSVGTWTGSLRYEIREEDRMSCAWPD